MSSRRREPRRQVRQAVAEADLPAKVPGQHRWTAVAGYTLTAGQVAAASSGATVTLAPENMFTLGTGCYDCEQQYGEHEPECPMAADPDAAPAPPTALIEPLPGDSAQAEMAVEVAGQSHLLVKEVTTSAAMMHKTTGGYAPAVLLTLTGRYNRTAVEASQDAILALDAAMHLRDTLAHTIDWLHQHGGDGSEVEP